MEITNDIKYVGVNDHEVDLFEGQYVVENGMAYNSYVILDEKTAVMDTVDARFTHEWLDNVQAALGIPQAGLPDYPAYGARPFCQYRQFYAGIQGHCDCLLRKSICHDEAVFRHRF